MHDVRYISPFAPPPLADVKKPQYWGRLYGSSLGLLLQQAAQQQPGLTVVITENANAAQRLTDDLRFYAGNNISLPLLQFPDWETLPYDAFSPHQDIISERLATLSTLAVIKQGLLIVPVQTLLHRVSPKEYINAHSFQLQIGQILSIDEFREQLTNSGYQCVSTVVEHGEFVVRGSLLDVFPMGSQHPFRIELFDDEIESIRTFEAETQRTIEKIERISLLPAREFPLDKAGIRQFRESFREHFSGDPQSSTIYTDISNARVPAGIEYYMPLFFPHMATLFDYFPAHTHIAFSKHIEENITHFCDEIQQRYEQARHNITRPLLAPEKIFQSAEELKQRLTDFANTEYQSFEYESTQACNFATQAPPKLIIDVHAENPTATLTDFIRQFKGRILFSAESSGRRETLLGILRDSQIYPHAVKNWSEFIDNDNRLCITVAPLEQGLLLEADQLTVIAESQLFGAQVMQRRRRKSSNRDADSIVRSLAELTPNAPVVHEEYGVGRYLGLQTLTVGDITTEFLTLEYADQDKLYVPVASLHLINRYTGASPDSAPLHKLGSGQWERAKRKAGERVRDVAAELLEVYAQRAAREGYAYTFDEAQYRGFSSEFAFEETPDQQNAIDNVIANMRATQPMDHLVCGDVGFGKTEVAMRAAFIAVLAGKQVAVLAPTTLLTQQHLQTFRDRFSEWPVNIESLSRFRTKKQQQQVIDELKQGKVDIVIGTHKLLSKDIKYKNLGLVIIDEEHRFGVRQKERFKTLRSEVDVLTLTATPIPRTLNMAMSGLRDLSIIASPPAKRLAIKTFVTQWQDHVIHEACIREIRRGGQIYFVHNDVESIAREAKKLEQLIPEARVHFAHGQMRERELEQVMSDFYHQRFNILVCTTIIETGIDIPNANTIIINRADRFGLAQLYQLRGRVGRSHHRAYAYLIIPHQSAMTADAKKRLEAIESIETLGTGFTLATHDLEIRGAGELLGDEQSGHLHEIGYSLYTEMLERAVATLKAGKQWNIDMLDESQTEIELHMSALIPEDYLADVHERLILYKRIASCKNDEDLDELQVEMIDRFGLLPESSKNLIEITKIKLQATALGIRKIDLHADGGRIIFNDQPNIEPATVIQLIQTQSNKYKLDGQDKLKILSASDDNRKRIQEVRQLLNSLSNTQAA